MIDGGGGRHKRRAMKKSEASKRHNYSLTNLCFLSPFVSSSSYNTLAPHDVIYARNTVINATNVYGNCEQNYAGLPASGVGNGNSGQGSIYNVLFVGK